MPNNVKFYVRFNASSPESAARQTTDRYPTAQLFEKSLKIASENNKPVGELLRTVKNLDRSHYRMTSLGSRYEKLFVRFQHSWQRPRVTAGHAIWGSNEWTAKPTKIIRKYIFFRTKQIFVVSQLLWHKYWWISDVINISVYYIH